MEDGLFREGDVGYIYYALGRELYTMKWMIWVNRWALRVCLGAYWALLIPRKWHIVDGPSKENTTKLEHNWKT
jgi:hypothetical protein